MHLNLAPKSCTSILHTGPKSLTGPKSCTTTDEDKGDDVDDEYDEIDDEVENVGEEVSEE